MGIKYLTLHSPQVRSGDLISSCLAGRSYDKLEEALSSLWGRKAVLTGSGRQAIEIALKSIGVGRGDEVIVPAFICSSVGEAVVRDGAEPVFADVGANDINIDPGSLESLVTKDTKAIIAAHIFGLPARMDSIMAIAAKYKIPVIEDCCQAFGAVYQDRPAGSLGDFGIFSFGISKNISINGGGALCFQDKEQYPDILFHNSRLGTLSRRLMMGGTPIVFNPYIYRVFEKPLAAYSQRKNSSSDFSHYQSRLSNSESACILKQLQRYEAIKKLRDENAEIYRSHFRGHFRMVEIPAGSQPAYLYFPLFHAKAKELKNRLRRESIEVKDRDEMLFYALYEHPSFSRFKRSSLENVEKMENEYLVFPVGHSHSDTVYICQKTLEILKELN